MDDLKLMMVPFGLILAKEGLQRFANKKASKKKETKKTITTSKGRRASAMSGGETYEYDVMDDAEFQGGSAALFQDKFKSPFTGGNRLRSKWGGNDSPEPEYVETSVGGSRRKNQSQKYGGSSDAFSMLADTLKGNLLSTNRM